MLDSCIAIARRFLSLSIFAIIIPTYFMDALSSISFSSAVIMWLLLVELYTCYTRILL
jgi:hypothetical protein